MIASIGMLIAILVTVATPTAAGESILNIKMISLAMIIGSIIGAFFAIKVQMTQMPQLVAIFNGFGGGASAFVAASEFLKLENGSISFLVISIILSLLIGTLTFTGSFIAFGKLQGLITTKPVTFLGQQFLNAILALGMLVAVYMIPATDYNLLYIVVISCCYKCCYMLYR